MKIENIHYIAQDGISYSNAYEYYPFGGTFNSDQKGEGTPFRYNGKELEPDDGLDWYDYAARRYDPPLGRFTSIDPLAAKRPDISPYAYCTNNPIMNIDPNGEEVKPNGQDEYNMILGTLPQNARSFVVIDNQGLIDKNVINNYNGNDYNTNSLKELVNDPMIVEVSLDKSFSWKIGTAYQHDPEVTSLPNPYPLGHISISANPDPAHIINDYSTGEEGSVGKTLFPDKIGPQNSTNSNVQIHINSDLSLKARSEAYSHEANGHALMYFRTKYNHEAASHHAYDHLKDENLTLKTLIIKSKMETIKNF